MPCRRQRLDPAQPFLELGTRQAQGSGLRRRRGEEAGALRAEHARRPGAAVAASRHTIRLPSRPRSAAKCRSEVRHQQQQLAGAVMGSLVIVAAEAGC